MHFRSEFQPGLANKGGWLIVFFIFSILTFFAYLRLAAATVVSGGQASPALALSVAFAILIALIGLLRRKRWGYYGFLLIGGFLVVLQGLLMLGDTDQALMTDWKFDMPMLYEWLITIGWMGYFVRSRRVYSLVFGTGLADG